jgi:hypothetical protein
LASQKDLDVILRIASCFLFPSLEHSLEPF